MKLSLPYKGANPYTITQGFIPNVHPALDMAIFNPKGGWGTPLHAPEDCTVLLLKSDDHTPGKTAPFAKGYGIWLKGLETGYTHLYWHTTPIFPVSVGQTVKRGQIVGYMGNSGHTTAGGVRVSTEEGLSSYKGTHLHWEALDPSWEIGKPKVFVDITKEIDWNSQPTYTTLDFLKAATVVAAKTTRLISR